MCTEFFLALIYFITILVVNIFIFSLLKSYFRNIVEMLKLKRIILLFQTNNNDLLVSFYHLLKEKKIKNNKILKTFSLPKNKKDILIAGKTIEFFNINMKPEKSFDFYLQLLKNQYLSN
jgi:hypothetical protein